MPDPFPISADVWALAQAADKAAMRDVLDVVPGTDVQVYDPKLALGSGIALPFVVAFRNIPVLTTGAPADLASVQLPAWCTRWILYWTTPFRCIAESAAGTLAGASFSIGAAAGGASGFNTFAGPASTSVAVIGGGPGTSFPFATSDTIFLRQNANSANAGTISVYALIVPLL